jgi:hypothetical protein
MYPSNLHNVSAVNVIMMHRPTRSITMLIGKRKFWSIRLRLLPLLADYTRVALLDNLKGSKFDTWLFGLQAYDADATILI